jgi:hypothetical protein
MAYISLSLHIHYKLHFFHDIDLLWAASMFCINTCLSDLWVLNHGCCTSVLLCGPESHMVYFSDLQSVHPTLVTFKPDQPKFLKRTVGGFVGFRCIVKATYFGENERLYGSVKCNSPSEPKVGDSNHCKDLHFLGTKN